MKITSLEKALKIYEEIKKLDQKIIELEKTAMIIANTSNGITLKLKVSDGNKKSNDDEVHYPESLPGFEQMINSHFMGAYIGRAYAESINPQKKNSDSTISEEISEQSALQILGIILNEYMARRKKLMHILQRNGVTI